MSGERIADAIGRTEYGEHPDEVDRADRLAQVDALLATGVVVDVDELMDPDVTVAWNDACDALLPLGWRPLVTWPGELEVKLVPPYVTSDRTDACLSPCVTVGWAPDPFRYGCPIWDTGDASWETFPTITALLDWLATP